MVQIQHIKKGDTVVLFSTREINITSITLNVTSRNILEYHIFSG